VRQPGFTAARAPRLDRRRVVVEADDARAHTRSDSRSSTRCRRCRCLGDHTRVASRNAFLLVATLLPMGFLARSRAVLRTPAPGAQVHPWLGAAVVGALGRVARARRAIAACLVLLS
jgi:hypothetical protein